MAAYFLNIWQTIRSHLPGSCGERTELDHFAKHGQGKSDTEMASYRHYEGTEDGGAPRIAGTEDYDTDVPPRKASGAGEFESEFGGQSGNKIDEWQAGWNVTNAIQVTFHLCWCFFPKRNLKFWIEHLILGRNIYIYLHFFFLDQMF